MDFAHYWFGGSGDGPIPFPIGNSLRFRALPSGFTNLTRTISTTGNGQVWTVSFWYKTNPYTARVHEVFGGSGNFTLRPSENTVRCICSGVGGVGTYVKSDGEYRDSSAWYHIVWRFDSTQAVDADREQIYINGVRVPQTVIRGHWQDSIPGGFNQAGQSWVVGSEQVGGLNPIEGYLSAFHHLDGQSVGPDTFGEFNADGVWVPIDVNLTQAQYGVNGFFLDFSDPADIGADRSGNGNNFTPTGFELTDTTNALYDWVADSPTDNYPTLNPLHKGNVTTSNANLRAQVNVIVQNIGTTQAFPKTGKWYFEQGPHDFFSGHNISIADRSAPLTSSLAGATTKCVSWANNGELIVNGNLTQGYPTFGATDVVGALYDADANTVTFYKNGTVAIPAVNTEPGIEYFPFLTIYSHSATVNYGNRPLQHLPAGASPLSTAGMEDVAITNPSEHFRVITDSTANILTNAQATFGAGNTLAFIKGRDSNGQWQNVDDTAFGAGNCLPYPGTKSLRAYAAPAGTNAVAYCWNTKGGLNLEAGLEVIQYTGDGQSNRDIPHNLGEAPKFGIIQNLAANVDLPAYHFEADPGKTQADRLIWNTDVSALFNSSIFPDFWDATNIKVGNVAAVNGAGAAFVAFVWKEVPGYSAMGSYNTNGNADGPFVYTGFRPALVIVKDTNGANAWHLCDTQLNPYNQASQHLRADNLGGEYAPSAQIDILSNGFKVRGTGGPYNNTSNRNIVYVCFAEHPFGGGNVAPSPAR